MTSIDFSVSFVPNFTLGCSMRASVDGVHESLHDTIAFGASLATRTVNVAVDPTGESSSSEVLPSMDAVNTNIEQSNPVKPPMH
jgi:hypothetical protein